jgi:cellulose synthase/poly-beta-1,6-N-acetylglucosamine synthase-like glycosyltransferase
LVLQRSIIAVRLDVLVPSRNRSGLLARALESLLAAPIPPGLDVRVAVINNGSTDSTAALLDWKVARYPGRIDVINERRRGKSRALNAAIVRSTADLIGMIDDDEEIDDGWYGEIYQAFQDPSLDFIGGPYRPRWSTPRPDWLPQEYLAVIGSVDSGPEARDFGPDFPGILKGGNAVIRREVLLRVGPYAEHLGPSGMARLLSCEDEEMYLRLLKAGARGRYLPTLIVHHHVCESRITPAYFRKWCFWRGVSRGLMDRAHPMPVAYLGGVPRFLYGRAAQAMFNLSARMLGSNRPRRLADELSLWDLAGYWWGRHIYTLARYSPVRSRRNPRGTPSQSSGESWTLSCYPTHPYGQGSGGDDHHQACGCGVVEDRRASAPTR